MRVCNEQILLLRIPGNHHLVHAAADRGVEGSDGHGIRGGFAHTSASASLRRRIRRDVYVLQPLPLRSKYLDPVLTTLADVDAPVIRDLDKMQRRRELLFLGRWFTGPLIAGNRLVGDLAQRHPVPAPATFELTGRGVVDGDALLIDDVDLVGDLVELKAPHVHDCVDVLVVLAAFAKSGCRPRCRVSAACDQSPRQTRRRA